MTNKAAVQIGLRNLAFLTVAAVAFGVWQHSVPAGVFILAALYIVMPYAG